MILIFSCINPSYTLKAFLRVNKNKDFFKSMNNKTGTNIGEDVELATWGPFRGAPKDDQHPYN